MQAIEFETLIDKDGHIHVPQEFQHAYGKIARLVVLLPEQPFEPSKPQPRVAGLHQGAAWVSEDFDEPLPD